MAPPGGYAGEDAGRANAPAGTDCAKVIFVPGGASDARLSHDGPARSGTPQTAIGSIAAKKLVVDFIGPPSPHQRKVGMVLFRQISQTINRGLVYVDRLRI